MDTTIELLKRTSFNFDNLAGNQTEEIEIIKHLDVSQWNEYVILLRSHSHTLPTGGVIGIRVRPSSPSGEDPSQDFFDNDNNQDVTIASTDTAPFLDRQDVSSLDVSHLRVSVIATQPASPSTLEGEISAVLSVKQA